MINECIHDTAIVKNSKIDNTARVWKQVFLNNCVVDEKANIGDFTRAEDSYFGNMVSIQRNSLIYSCSIGKYSYTGKNFTSWHAKIGAFCSISWNVVIGGADHDYKRLTTHAFLYSPHMGLMNQNECGYNRFSEPCEIGNDVWVGANAVICRNVTIGDGAVIGAGSVVTHDVEPYTIVAGIPARPIKKRFDDKIIDKLQKLKWWKLDDATIRDNFDLFNSEPTDRIIFELEKLMFDKKIQAK